MLHIIAVPHSTLGRIKRGEMFLSHHDRDNHEVIYCQACRAPVVNSAYGIRRYILGSQPFVDKNNLFRHVEASRCEQAFKKLGYNSNGEKI